MLKLILLLSIFCSFPLSLKNNINETSISKKSQSEDIFTIKKYDGRDYNYLTSVKNQGYKNTCWSYSLASASEASILKEGFSSFNKENLDLSEDNIAYNALNRDGSKDKFNLTKNDTFNSNYDKGYYLEPAINSLFQYTSPTLIDQIGYQDADFKIENVIKLDPRNILEIKEAIYKYGAVTFTFDVSNSFDGMVYYNSNVPNTSYRHAATIVGWDDEISKTNYYPNSSLDGGFICKNSYGSYLHDNGYFYLSYDSKIDEVFALDYMDKATYQNVYYYDGYNENITYSKYSNKSAVIFKAQDRSLTKDEYLEGLTFSLNGKNVDVKIEIYKNLYADESFTYSSLNNPTKGELVLTQNEYYEQDGIYTVKLKEKIKLEKNEFFSIVLTLNNPSNDAYINLSSEYNSRNDLCFYYLNDKRNGYFKGENSGYALRIHALTNTYLNNKEDIKDIKYLDFSYDNTPQIYKENINLKYNLLDKDYVLVNDKDYKLIDLGYSLNDFEMSSDDALIGSKQYKIEGINDYKGEIYFSIPINIAKYPSLEEIGFLNENNQVVINLDKSPKCYKDIKLPDGFKFVYPDEKIVVGENTGNYLTYVGEDSIHYRKTFFDVVLNVSEIIDKIDINLAEFNKINDETYTSKGIEPVLEIKYNDKILNLNKDYLVKYKDNIDAGVAKIVIQGINDFNGEKIISFNILKAQNEIYNFKYENNKFSANAKFGQVHFKFYQDEDCLNEVKNLEENTYYYAKAYVEGTNNYDEVFSDEYIKFQLNNSSNEEDNNINENENNLSTLYISIFVSLGILVMTIIGVLTYNSIRKK